MNHSFQPSIGNKLKCARCTFPEVQHGNEAECDCCPNIGTVEVVFGNMMMCPSCIAREKETSAANMSPEKQQERVDAMNQSMDSRLQLARHIDESINVRTDLFNAATVSINELREIIDNDETITNKPYALAEELKNRFNHFKTVVFELNEKIMEAGNQQKAIQVYLNNLANQLRAEEREKLKISDISYQPTKVKPVKPKTIKTSSVKKLDKVELRKYAAELGVAEFTLQMLVVSKGITVEEAANMLRKSINEAKSEV